MHEWLYVNESDWIGTESDHDFDVNVKIITKVKVNQIIHYLSDLSLKSL